LTALAPSLLAGPPPPSMAPPEEPFSTLPGPTQNGQLALLTPPPLSPNVIVTGVAGQLLHSQPMFAPINSTYTSFDLQSLRFVCTANNQTPVAPPQTCTLQVTGVKAVGGSTVVQELGFNPVLGVNPFKSATFASTFTRLKSVNFQLLQSTTGQSLTEVAIDDVAYKAYRACR
jgi:hypothetical protein